jgi:hypothetical protein
MKDIVKSVMKFCVFVFLINLPFITATQLLGMDAFLDSFEHTEHYIYLQEGGTSTGIDIDEEEYLILQKSSHPGFTIYDGELILYCNGEGKTACHRISCISSIGSIKRYQPIDNNNIPADEPIYDAQIIGKVISIVDNNLWNVVAMKFWDLSIHELNVHAFFAND